MQRVWGIIPIEKIVKKLLSLTDIYYTCLILPTLSEVLNILTFLKGKEGGGI